MKIISCVGFHATGSGAVDDFLREFDNIKSAKYGAECRVIPDPDGIADLEYNLFDNYRRLNAAFALKRFLYFVEREKRTYYHIFGKNWETVSKKYIDSICAFSYKGYFGADTREFRGAKLFIYKTRRLINKFLPKPFKKNSYYSYFKNEITYFSNCSREEFLEKTHQYIYELCKILNPDDKDFVVLDQAISSNNAEHHMKYLPKDSKVIIVARDPRDVYLNNIVKHNDHVLPHDVKQFCEVFRKQREMTPFSSAHIMFINFEDMIYKYEETTEKIVAFLGLNEENHLWVKKYFNPEISVKNTRLWEQYPERQEEVKIIEEKLSDFLYPYDS